MGSYLPNTPTQTFFETVTNSEGTSVRIPLDNGRVYTYVNGTTNKAPTYSDSDLKIPNQNPIKLDSNGQARIFLDSQLLYTFVVKDKDGNTIETINDIAPLVSVLSSGTNLETDLDITAGALISSANNDINFQPNGTGTLTVTTSDGNYEDRVAHDDDIPNLAFLTGYVSSNSLTDTQAGASSTANKFIKDSHLDLWQHNPTTFAIFVGTGSPSAQFSHNVSSISQDATGVYTINFTSAYSATAARTCLVSCSRYAAGTANKIWVSAIGTTSVTVTIKDTGATARDPATICVAVFGTLS